MEYSVNPKAWGAVFAVPTVITDEHIKMASGQQLRVLLFMLRHNGEEYDIEFLAKGVGMTAEEVHDSMRYWVETGIVLKDNQPAVVKVAEPKKKPDNSKTHLEVPETIPTYNQVVTRTDESPELRLLFNELQVKLGKTIGYDVQAKFLYIYDHYDLPVEVILTIVQYAVNKKEMTSVAYITKVAKNWADDGINTMEKAEKKLESLENSDKLWHKFVSMIRENPPQFTEKRAALLDKWTTVYGFSLQMIYFAYEDMIESTNKINFNYMDKILENWHKENIKNNKELMNYKKCRAENAGNTKPGKKAVNKVNTSKDASYDIEKYNEKAQSVPKYKRRQS